MAGKSRGRPKGSGYKIDYAKVRALARYQSLQQEIALELHMSEEEFSRKLKTDKELSMAFNGGQNLGKVGGRKLFYESMYPLYYTFCTNPDCGAITESTIKFLPKCPECGSISQGEEPKFYAPKYKREPGDGENQRLFAKTYLGMSDKVTHQGDTDKPLVFGTLADLALAAAARKKERNAQKETRPAPKVSAVKEDES